MLRVSVHNSKQHFQREISEGPLFFGTTAEGGENPNHHESKIGQKLLLTLEDPAASSLHLKIDWSDTTKLRLTNFGRSIALNAGPRVHRGRTVELDVPTTLRLGETHIQFTNASTVATVDSALVELNALGLEGETEQQVSPGPNTLASWLETLGELQQVVAGSHELFLLATQALFNPGGLDGGMILLPSIDGWKIHASYIPYPEHGFNYRCDLIKQVVDSKKSIFHDGMTLDKSGEIHEDVHSAVVCPILDGDNQVAAILYGFRSLHRRNSRRGIRMLEAQFVQVVANSLSAGLLRLNSEKDAARSKILLEQAFAPNVAQKLQDNTNILVGQEREVSVLFADLRNFSAISERVGAEVTYEFLSSVMERFSTIITDFDGVIIDFYGDGISAFWNAPIEQLEHPVFAVEAGFEILASLPELNMLWKDRVDEEVSVGIGITTGVALVGNSGCQKRLKYGPRGSVVNLASRLENKTKELKIPLLVSEETAQRVSGAFSTQRIISDAVKGYPQPVPIYRVLQDSNTRVKANHKLYDKALIEYEKGNRDSASDLLQRFAERSPNDPVVKILEKRLSAKRTSKSQKDKLKPAL